MRRFFAFTLVFGVVLATLGLTAPPVVASCIAPVPLDQAVDGASSVFVGTVVELRSYDRFAVFDVEDVWKGDLAEKVEVNGGPALASLESTDEGVGLATSVDRTYRLGGRYLVVSYGFDRDDVLADSACSATREYTHDLIDFRPADAHAPTPTEITETDSTDDSDEPDEVTPPVDSEKVDIDSSATSWWLAATGAVLGAGGIGALVLWRRRM